MSTIKYAAPPPTIPRWLNRIVAGLLRSPFHVFMSRTTLLLTVAGRRSGQSYTLPVRYLREGNTLITTTYSPRKWWRNLQGEAPVELYLAGHKVTGKARASTEPEEVEQGIRAILQHMPGDAHYYRVSLDGQRQPDATDLALAVRSNVLITIHLVDKDQA